MRRPAAFALAIALGATAALALVSCGGSDDAKLLPGATAQEISENLDRVKQYEEEGECVGASDAVGEVSAQVEALTGVDAKLKRALQHGTARLAEVVASCEEEEPTTEAIAPSTEATTTESTEPPGQEKKREKEAEKAEKEAEKPPKEKASPPGPPETTPTEPPAPTAPTEEVPPPEGGGTGASGGVSPGAPVGGGE